MNLLAPSGLWLALVIPAVVAMYLLKIKRRRQTVPAIEFWRELAGKTQVRSLFQRLKRWLSLALWLLIVLCLILAVSNPVLSLGRIKPQSIVIIVDNSASMQSREAAGSDPPATRLSLALAAVDELTTRRPVMDEWLLIESSIRPRVRQPWTTDRKAVRDAATQIAPCFGASDVKTAVELASQLLTGKERPCIVVISDGGAGVVEKLIAGNDKIVHWPIGETNDNLGITRLAVRPQRDELTHHVFVRATNGSAASVETKIVFELDGSITSIEPMTIDAGTSSERTITINAPQGGVLRAYLDREDALPLDNEAFAVLPPIREASVALVAPPDESFFFEQAILAMDSLVDKAESRVLSPEEFDDATSSFSPDVAIFNNCKPARLPDRGRFVFVNQWPEQLGARSIGRLERPSLSITDRDHQITKYLDLGAVGLARAVRVDVPESAQVLAQSETGDPLVFLVSEPDRTSLCIAFDVMESDLPFRVAFPLMLRNAISFLSGEGSAWVLDQYRIGQTIEPLRELPDAITHVTATQLDQSGVASSELNVTNRRFTFAGTARPAPIRFQIGGEDAYTAVNLADESESRIAPARADSSFEQKLVLSGRLLGAMPWLALACAATTLIGIEWLTYHHRWTE